MPMIPRTLTKECSLTALPGDLTAILAVGWVSRQGYGECISKDLRRRTDGGEQGTWQNKERMGKEDKGREK